MELVFGLLVLLWPFSVSPANPPSPYAVLPTRGIATWSPDPQTGYIFYLQKPEPTSVMTGPTARVTGVEGIQLTELGFDFRTDGHCGAGAPRYNVVTEDGGRRRRSG